MADVSKLNIALGIILIGGVALGGIGGRAVDQIFEDTITNTKAIIVHEGRITTVEERQATDRELFTDILNELKKLGESSIRQEEQLKRLKLIE
jgi:tetrahydromethanopterin S-methyltransferase subunit A